MRVTGSQLLVVLLAGAALLASLFAQAFLPARFLLDHGHIERVIHDPEVSPENTSFQAIAAFYRAIGVGSAPEAAALLGVAVLVLALALAIGFERLAHIGIVDALLLGAALLVGVAYLAQYSKEFVTALVVVGLLVWGGRRGGDLFVVLACLGYAATMRPYWVLVAVLYVAWRWVLPRLRNPLWLPVLALAVYVVAQPVFVLALGTDLDGQRAWLNAERADVNVATLITAPLPGEGPVSAVLGTLVVLLLLVVPVGLLTSGAVYHTAAGLLILGLWACTFTAIATGACRRRPREVDAADPVLRARAAALLLALLVVQAIFEPDYGSYLKHLAPMLPLMVAVVARHPATATNRRLRAARAAAARGYGASAPSHAAAGDAPSGWHAPASREAAP